MNETSKTVAFIILAGILGVAAAWSHWMTQPQPVTGFEKVGQEFFPEFEDASTATSLSVTAYDSETDGLKEFSVMLKDGLWRIPSHHDYPAEAADRLARTATSLIGLERESIVERRANKHEEYGVVDPADENADPESAGQRITLRDEAGEIVADYIIGKPAGSAAEDGNQMVRSIQQDSDYYYVRVPEEKETYKAKLQIDLSTRFSDWIQPDLLKLEAADINRLEIDNYELVEQDVQVGNRMVTQLAKNVIDRQRLTRDGFAPWELEGLNPTTEELDTLMIESVATLLDSLKIVGVRPKLKLDGQLLVKSDLSINEELARKDPLQFQNRIISLQNDLERKGFTIGQTSEDPTSVALLASRGELRAATKNGVLYTLYFGRSVSGDTQEIEVGGATSEEVTNPEDGGTETAENETEGEAGSDEAATAENKSRYVAIRVDFDPTALGEPPVQPTEPAAPEKPEGYDEWKAQKDDKPDGDSDAAESPENAGSQNQEEQSAPPVPPEDVAAANQEEFEAYEAGLAEYETAQIQYTTDLEMFETRKIEFEAREKTGRELVEELNERFAEWFYVVPAESLSKLKLTREDIVNVRETTPPNLQPPPSPGDSGLPAAPDIDFPEGAGESSEPSEQATEDAAEKSAKEDSGESGDEAGKKDDESLDNEDG